MSKIEVNEIDPSSGTTLTIGGDLDTNEKNIITASNRDLNLYPNGTGAVEIGGNTNPGTIILNCEQNSHGIKLQSPPHSANQSYTLKFPSGNVTAGKFLKVDSVSGSGTTGVGTMTFADAGGGGKIGQVVSTNKTDTYSQSVSLAGDSNIVTGLTVNITPSATTSKILIFVNVSIGVDGSHGMGFKLFRDSTQIDLADSSSSRRQNSKGMQANGGTSYNENLSTNFLDTPNTTSQITYGIKINHTSSSSKGMRVNSSFDDPDDSKLGRQASTITAMEVLA